ncbi:DUF2155 domain-containing protein [Pontibaca salina]|uniref:DUF2155 domain-containing protein n=1 Tax=Pontibaca salina TaxID=2795731 RepID=A0A934HS63_9RHOB|nr:DUF2155 domain-containing protein [Pontibaca salina]MBI6628644.1 DUF2155 domain-containing protein [Pontibaca salina]
MRWLAALMLALGLTSAAGMAQTSVDSGLGAVLRGLDKVNGETVDVEIPWGGTLNVFGLSVTVQDCRYPPENPTGDAFALLTITDRVSGYQAFHGWMVASSPALNALDHNRYDVWVLRCITS